MPKEELTKPYLSIEVSGPAGEKIGFLHVASSRTKIEIGDAYGREFKLVQCLFSPQNNVFSKYNPVAQTYERASSAMGIPQDEYGGLLESSLQTLRAGKTAEYLTFTTDQGRVRMDIIG